MVRNYKRVEGSHKHKGRIDEPKLAQCIALIEQGCTAPDIEKETGVSVATIGRVRRNMRRFGSARAPRYKKLGRPPKNKTTVGTGEFILEGIGDTSIAESSFATTNPFEQEPLGMAAFASHNDISSFFLRKSPAKDRALVILNQPIADRDLLHRLWISSSYRICVDGGANRLHDLLGPLGGPDDDQRHNYLPDAIHGDLDSLTPPVSDYYISKGVAVTHDPDQFSTDFNKAVRRVVSRAEVTRDVIILGTIGGRLDQGIGLLSEMSREQIRFPHLKFWLVSEESISFILDSQQPQENPAPEPGAKVKHLIMGLKSRGVFTPNVGILPLWGPASITTRGLEWDVEDWPTEMGGQVSTSNHVMKEEVTIEVAGRVLFTIERVPVLPKSN